jgi:hypothetical protein
MLLEDVVAWARVVENMRSFYRSKLLIKYLRFTGYVS